jgi:hypothetical protein
MASHTRLGNQGGSWIWGEAHHVARTRLFPLELQAMAVKQMPKRQKRLRKSFHGFYRLWIKDLEDVVQMIQRASDSSAINIVAETGDFRFEIDNAEDFREQVFSDHNIEQLDLFEIQSQDGRTRLELSRRRAFVVVLDPEPKDLGTVQLLAELMDSRHRLSAWGFPIAVFFLGQFVGGLLAVAVSVEDWMSTNTESALMVWAGIVVGLASALGYLLTARRVTLFTRTEADAPPWLKRNKDALVTNFWVSLLFFALGLVVGKLF